MVLKFVPTLALAQNSNELLFAENAMSLEELSQSFDCRAGIYDQRQGQ